MQSLGECVLASMRVCVGDTARVMEDFWHQYNGWITVQSVRSPIARHRSYVGYTGLLHQRTVYTYMDVVMINIY